MKLKIRPKRRFNKKAALVPFLALIMFIGGIALVMYYNQKGIDASMSFGAPQREILETYADGEAARQYIMLSAKYAAHQALYSLSSNGGYESASCQPDVIPECKLTLGATEVEAFVCEEESVANFEEDSGEHSMGDSTDASLCKQYDIIGFCTHYPCTFTVNNNIQCELKDDGVICGISDSADATVDLSAEDASSLKSILRTFECAGADSDKCADYGAVLDEVVPLTMTMECINQTFERECELSPCGGIGNYVYWANDAQVCTPTSANLSVIFELFFYNFFDNYLYKYDNIEMDDELYTLYDAVDYDLDIDLSSRVIEGIPAKELYYTVEEDEDGNIIELEETAEESAIWFEKTIEDKKNAGVKPTVTFEYSVNPYFIYEIPYSPTQMFSSVRAEANRALAGIGGCSGDIATRAAEQQTALNAALLSEDESISAVPVFNWTITGEQVEGACVVKFDAALTSYAIYGVNPVGNVSVVETAAPIRFAVKYSSGVVSV